jgi:hypothetical protein
MMDAVKKILSKIINIPQAKTSQHPLTLKELNTNAKHRVSVIAKEFKKGFEFIGNHPKSVTFFGSARLDENDPYYQKARSIAKRVAEAGYSVVSGGGPGIMEAANRGASDLGKNAKSLGICIQLPREQKSNPYITDEISFRHFFSRKVIMTFSAEAFLYFPGGYGTIDEFFEIITLVQTGKIEKVPMILVGNDFWKPFDEVFRKSLLEKYHTISEEDLNLYTITEDEEVILDIIKKAPMRKE